MRNVAKLVALVATFAAGVLLAAAIATGGGLLETTSTDTTVADTATTTADTTSTTESTSTGTETTPAVTTVFTTTVEQTVEQTTTRLVPLPTSGTTTTGSTGGESSTPAWVWVLLGILAAGLIALIVLLARRGGGGASADERQRQLEAVVGSWIGQGWAIETQTADTVVLRRGAESMLVTVDRAGHVTTRPLPAS